jgi:hypothetical protein
MQLVVYPVLHGVHGGAVKQQPMYGWIVNVSRGVMVWPIHSDTLKG